jgi:preprotein translocase subunit SecE
VNAFFRELLRTGIYKRTQGRITRQVTWVAVAVIVALGLYQLHVNLIDYQLSVQYAVPGLLLVLGLWAAYRLVNVPAFADFLIAVEAEMNKVSWPTRSELFRSSVVVLVTIFSLAVVLFVFDFIWNSIFKMLKIL